ncbi:MAG TPA: hypothetical protein DCZ92_00590 [Elusimicrobia bacterium]|nr:MAG: hypothetical protein A2016_09895 [Elusimicrobia bacterium GWF2_62_30]HBA59323.1 hypothetical protein [Elusimicrobiota bacterium]
MKTIIKVLFLAVSFAGTAAAEDDYSDFIYTWKYASYNREYRLAYGCGDGNCYGPYPKFASNTTPNGYANFPDSPGYPPALGLPKSSNDKYSAVIFNCRNGKGKSEQYDYNDLSGSFGASMEVKTWLSDQGAQSTYYNLTDLHIVVTRTDNSVPMPDRGEVCRGILKAFRDDMLREVLPKKSESRIFGELMGLCGYLPGEAGMMCGMGGVINSLLDGLTNLNYRENIISLDNNSVLKGLEKTAVTAMLTAAMLKYGSITEAQKYLFGKSGNFLIDNTVRSSKMQGAVCYDKRLAYNPFDPSSKGYTACMSGDLTGMMDLYDRSVLPLIQ